MESVLEQKSRRASGRRKGLAVWGGIVFFWLSSPVVATEPYIYLIEPFLDYGILIHFNMDANRYYQVQYTETLVNGMPGGNWTNLLNEPAFNSFPNGHFIAFDTRLRPQRFYRLYVYP